MLTCRCRLVLQVRNDPNAVQALADALRRSGQAAAGSDLWHAALMQVTSFRMRMHLRRLHILQQQGPPVGVVLFNGAAEWLFLQSVMVSAPACLQNLQGSPECSTVAAEAVVVCFEAHLGVQPDATMLCSRRRSRRHLLPESRRPAYSSLPPVR